MLGDVQAARSIVAAAGLPSSRGAAGAPAHQREQGDRASARPGPARQRGRRGAPLGNTTKNPSGVAGQGLSERDRERRSGRYAQRQVLWKESHLPRVCACGRRRIGDDDPSLRMQDGVAHFAGLQLCGSIWGCPVCSPRIRQERAEEINAGLLELITTPIHWGEGPARARTCPIDGRKDATTGTALLLTVTLPHDWGEALSDLLDVVSDGHAALTSGRGWVEDQETFRLVGYIRSHDTTQGANGWHPHLHSVLCVAGELTPAELVRLKRRLYVRWARSIVGRRPRAGQRGEAWEGKRRAPSYRHGITLEQARSIEDVARYAADVAGGNEVEMEPRYRVVTGERSGVGLELTRADLKQGGRDAQGRAVSRTPWEILRDIAVAEVCDADGVVNEQRERDLALWHEWEEATHGKQAIRWSAGLKAILRVRERTDEEIVAEEIGGEELHRFTTLEWWAVCGTAGAPVAVLRQAETGGAAAVVAYLEAIVPAWQERRARDRAWEERHAVLTRAGPRARLVSAA